MYLVVLVDILQGMKTKMVTAIRESKRKVTYETMNEDKTIVQQMEEEWPQMTAEFRRLQREQYELFLHNNTIMVQVTFQLEHNYKLKKK